jgi:hypothetical protein
MSENLPNELIVDTRKQTQSVVMSPELQEAMPHIFEAFGKAERPFLADPENYLTRLQDSVFIFKSKTGAEVACSLLYDDSSRKDELLVIFAPFSDGAPKSSGEQIFNYITEPLPSGAKGLIAKENAAPNSWNQTTKSSVVFELLGALGSGMPVLTIYSPMPTRAYSKRERQAFKQGDFTPASRIALEAINEAQQRLHGAHSETRIDKANLHGASLGASNAIGAAKDLLGKDITVPSVTAQELIMGPASFFDVAKRFTVAGRAGEPSSVELPKGTPPRIYEPRIRRKIDGNGNELAMFLRMAQAVKPTYLRGLAHPEQTVSNIEHLLDNNVSLLVALAENSGLTYQTKSYLPNDKEKVITVRGEKGQFADHLIDEHVALTGLITALGIKK